MPIPYDSITAKASPMFCPSGAHGYHPDDAAMRTGFVASGAGIRRGAVVPELRLENIAALVTALLGLEFDTPDSVLLPGVLTDDIEQR